jgi:hypothetical protein
VAVWHSVRQGGDTKTARSRRTLALPQAAVQALREHRKRQAEDRLAAGALWQDHDLVFASVIGTRLDAANVRRAGRRRCREGARARAGLRSGDGLRSVRARPSSLSWLGESDSRQPRSDFPFEEPACTPAWRHDVACFERRASLAAALRRSRCHSPAYGTRRSGIVWAASAAHVPGCPGSGGGAVGRTSTSCPPQSGQGGRSS